MLTPQGPKAIETFQVGDEILTRLEWANILSAELVADVGREFLLGAPWEESEFWEDGAFLGITRSSYQQWLEKGARPLLSYLRRKYPNLRRVKYPT